MRLSADGAIQQALRANGFAIISARGDCRAALRNLAPTLDDARMRSRAVEASGRAAFEISRVAAAATTRIVTATTCIFCPTRPTRLESFS